MGFWQVLHCIFIMKKEKKSFFSVCKRCIDRDRFGGNGKTGFSDSVAGKIITDGEWDYPCSSGKNKGERAVFGNTEKIPAGGQIGIHVQQYSLFVRIDISDTGIGITEEEIPKIFSRFYRSFEVADLPGVGIGLYLARFIIQEQKGYIKVTSRKGKGSVFSVFLPCAGKNE